MTITVSAECGGRCGEEMSVSAPLSDIVAGGKVTLRATCDRCEHEFFIKIEDKNPEMSLKKALKRIEEYKIRDGFELMKGEMGF